LKTRIAWFGANLNTSAMLLHNSLHGIQAESRTFSHSLGGEKRFEDMGLHFLRNSRTVIANFNHNATVLLVGSNANLALPMHRIDGVIDNVGPDLVELAAKRIHQQRNLLVVALHRDS